ncbi:Proteasome subunit beta type [Caligus rogercresseyi]|uniref:Proteasome subunit beta type n=1 Tax=Caligus rogercresseyi TaxID=217165 RepID=A0A7T8K047_CALRO|nr:Proteasome subunit beta type [Caligus rogercresseyi]
MLSSLLYERRFGPFFVNPIVAGYDYVENKPFISGMDLIGASHHSRGLCGLGNFRGFTCW